MELKRNEILQRTWVVCLGALICCALWGSAFPCIKIGYKMFDIQAEYTGSQILFAGIRFFIAGIMAVIIGSIIGRKLIIPKRESIADILILSLFQTVAQYIFFYIGLANTTGVKASIIGSVNVFISIFVAGAIFHQEKMTRNKVIGSLIGFVGVVLVNMSEYGVNMTVSFKGEGFILFSAIAYAFSSVFLKKYSKDENPVALSGYQFIIGGIILMEVGLLMGGSFGKIQFRGIMMLLYLAFISAAAYSIWGILLKYNPVSRVAVFGFMNPVFGVLLSAIILGEGDLLGIKTIVSLILVSIGIYMVNFIKQSAETK